MQRKCNWTSTCFSKRRISSLHLSHSVACRFYSPVQPRRLETQQYRKKGSPGGHHRALGAAASIKALNAAWADNTGNYILLFVFCSSVWPGKNSQAAASDCVASLLLPGTGTGCWPVCVYEHLATVRGRDKPACACWRQMHAWTHSRYVGMTLSFLIEEIKMERKVCERGMGLGGIINQDGLDCMPILVSPGQNIMDLSF